MIANHKGEIPFVILIVPFLLGIAIGYNFLNSVNATYLTIILLLLSVAFIALNIFYKKLNLYKTRWIGGLLIMLILLLFGCVNITRSNELNHADHFSKKIAQFLVVKISNEPILKNGFLRFTADAEETISHNKRSKATGTLLITIKNGIAKNLYYGDELLIPAKYNPIDPPFNPAEFNYKKYLANQNIYYQAFLYPKQFYVLNKDAGNPVIAYSLRLRQRMVEKFKTNMRDTNAIAVASTLILGYKADLSNDILQAYSKTGTIHVLSVSGAHVAIIYILLTMALSFLGRYKYGKLLRAMLIILLIWYYSMLTGFSPAVCRAAVMITMVIIGKTYSRYINALNILAISAFFLLLYNPLFITDVGFQLSYLAVIGLVVFQPVIYKWLKFKNKWADKLWALCSVSIAAQVITFPLSVYYFHQFPVYFLVSNLFIIIPSAVIMYTGIIYLLLPQLPVISKSLAYVLEKSIIIMNKILALIEHIPYASIGKIWVNTLEYLLLYIMITCLFYFLFDPKKWLLKVSAVCLLILCISISIKQLNLVKSNTLTFLNLRKHTGIIFKAGNETLVLSDLPDTDKNYQYAVQPYLDSCMGNSSLHKLNEDIKNTFVGKKNNLIQFLNKRVLIYDKQVQNKLLPDKLNIDYIYITGNPEINLYLINKNYNYSMLVVDGSNTDDLITKVENQAKKMNINYKILKRNSSLILVSD